MKRERISIIKQDFDSIVKTEQGVEYWTARELMSRLGYDKWENFESVIKRAIESCATSGVNPDDHFRKVMEIAMTGKNTPRERTDYLLTRYACYLIAQNGDPKKEEIAFAQGYFAVQTRKQELIEERISYIERMEARGKLRESEKRLSKNIYERGVDDAGFARVRSKGDTALFGGLSTQQMKDRLGIKSKRPLADFLPTLTITAKNLATEMTNYNVEENNIQGEYAITGEHVQNNATIRKMLGERGIKPEELPPSEDIKKLERKAKAEDKKVVVKSGKLPKAK
ncbi:DNA damage-inducible protein D [Candidatus Saccharibacteria bacterium]|nr:DNA damage-inducible protein D [Candidatus Saccharibacteria bacterium]